MARRKEEEKILDVNAAMQGSLVFSDPINLRINGSFEGNLDTRGNLIIGKDAEVKADITGEDVTIAGRVRGKIKATEVLRFTSTAYVTGDVEVVKIAIEEGAVFNGKCTVMEGKISLEELADYLSIDESKIAEWVNSGKIPVEKEGSKLLFNRREVESWITQKS